MNVGEQEFLLPNLAAYPKPQRMRKPLATPEATDSASTHYFPVALRRERAWSPSHRLKIDILLHQLRAYRQAAISLEVGDNAADALLPVRYF
jgi:hypothetical protein